MCVAATFPLTVVTVVSPGVQCSCAAPPLENMLVTAIRYRHVPQDGQKLIVNFYILLEEKLFSTKFARERERVEVASIYHLSESGVRCEE